MFKWLEDEVFATVVAKCLLRAYIVCGLIVFIICICYFGCIWIRHIKKVQETKKVNKGE